jgi:hypothetical protein
VGAALILLVWGLSILAISGDGDDGAFGAGLLAGRTVAAIVQNGLVTGVSTGALSAPFAFLGLPVRAHQFDAAVERATLER